jgi:hypothetical protein
MYPILSESAPENPCIALEAIYHFTVFPSVVRKLLVFALSLSIGASACEIAIATLAKACWPTGPAVDKELVNYDNEVDDAFKLAFNLLKSSFPVS